MSLYIDLSEFLMNPITTGIQRIVGEMCRYLPNGIATPVRFRSDGYIGLSPSLIEVIGEYFRKGSALGREQIERLANFENGFKVNLSPGDVVLVPEVFGDYEQLAFFDSLPEEKLQRWRFIVFDLLPLTNPEYFDHGVGAFFFRYARIVRRSETCGFISEYSRDVYQRRLKRAGSYGGVVLRLGCDSLGDRATPLTLDRSLQFTVVGTIEPRKNHQLILEAFEPLLREIEGLKLAFLGKVGWVNPEFAQKIHALASDPDSGFCFYPTPDDGAIRAHIERSRATIYVSSAEGYGLPPVESLWLGTPVIASRTVPSLEHLSAGIRYVEPLDVVNLRRAIVDFLDEDYARKKIEETTALNLPTWRSFTKEVLEWCGQPAGQFPPLVQGQTRTIDVQLSR